MNEKVRVASTDVKVIVKDGNVLMTTVDKVVRTESAPIALDLVIAVHDKTRQKNLRKNIATWIAAGAFTVATATPFFVVPEAARGDNNVTTPQAELVEETIFVAGLAVGIPAWRRMRKYDVEIDRLERQEKEIRAYIVKSGDAPKSVKVVGPAASK